MSWWKKAKKAKEDPFYVPYATNADTEVGKLKSSRDINNEEVPGIMLINDKTLATMTPKQLEAYLKRMGY